MSIIKAGLTVQTGYVVTSDDTGELEFKTGPSAITGLKIDGDQVVSINSVDKLSIPGGTEGQVLSTDGAGNLTWADGVSSIANSGATVYRFKYTATANQTEFSGVDDNGAELGAITETELHSSNHIVFLNGSTISEYTFIQTKLTLTTPAKANDELAIIIFTSFRIPDAVPASTGGEFRGSVSVKGSINALHNITAGGTITGNAAGLTGLTATQITTALGYTPYNGATNPNNYVTTLASMNSSAITTALGFAPYPNTNNKNYLSAPGTAFDNVTNTTPLTADHVESALGFTPYNATNPAAYITASALSPYLKTADAAVAIPTGTIWMWWGDVSHIPTGWNLCDGTNGTPNLVGRFPFGADNTHGVGSSGGSTDAAIVSHAHGAATVSEFTGNTLPSHDHNITDPAHRHSGVVVRAPLNNGTLQITTVTTGGNFTVGQTDSATTAIDVSPTPTYPNGSGVPSGTIASTTNINSTGVSASEKNMPPYLALNFIMKI